MVQWAESNPHIDKLNDYFNQWQVDYNSHCCLRAIKSANKLRGYEVHYHRAFFSYLFCPPRIKETAPYWIDNYEARILALCLAAELCHE